MDNPTLVFTPLVHGPVMVSLYLVAQFKTKRMTESTSTLATTSTLLETLLPTCKYAILQGTHRAGARWSPWLVTAIMR